MFKEFPGCVKKHLKEINPKKLRETIQNRIVNTVLFGMTEHIEKFDKCKPVLNTLEKYVKLPSFSSCLWKTMKSSSGSNVIGFLLMLGFVATSPFVPSLIVYVCHKTFELQEKEYKDTLDRIKQYFLFEIDGTKTPIMLDEIEASSSNIRKIEMLANEIDLKYLKKIEEDKYWTGFKKSGSKIKFNPVAAICCLAKERMILGRNIEDKEKINEIIKHINKKMSENSKKEFKETIDNIFGLSKYLNETTSKKCVLELVNGEEPKKLLIDEKLAGYWREYINTN